MGFLRPVIAAALLMSLAAFVSAQDTGSCYLKTSAAECAKGVIATTDCEWCNDTCLYQNTDCCSRFYEEDFCTNSTGCVWCPLEKNMEQQQCFTGTKCPDRTNMRKFCYNARNQSECEDMLGNEDNIGCQWCGYVGCVNHGECVGKTDLDFNYTVPTSCDYLWTDISFTVSIEPTLGRNTPISVEFKWLVKYNDNNSFPFLNPNVFQLSLPIVNCNRTSNDRLAKGERWNYTCTIKAGSFQHNQTWKMFYRTSIDGLLPYVAVAAQNVFVPSDWSSYVFHMGDCKQRTCIELLTADSCLGSTDHCSWCGENYGSTQCVAKPDDCFPFTIPMRDNEDILTGENWTYLSLGEPIGFNNGSSCMPDVGLSTSAYIWWQLPNSFLRVKAFQFLLHIDNNRVTNGVYYDIKWDLYDGDVPKRGSFDFPTGLGSRITGDTSKIGPFYAPGNYLVEISVFDNMDAITENYDGYVAIQWKEACPRLTILLPDACGGTVCDQQDIMYGWPKYNKVTVSAFYPWIQWQAPSLCGNAKTSGGSAFSSLPGVCDPDYGQHYCTDQCKCPIGWTSPFNMSYDCQPPYGENSSMFAEPNYTCGMHTFSSAVFGTNVSRGWIHTTDTSAACETQCCQMVECNAFTWYSESKECDLWSDVETATSCTDCTSGYTAHCPWEPVAGRLLDDYPYRQVDADDAKDCARECCELIDCVAWTYYDDGNLAPSGDLCHLFNSAPKWVDTTAADWAISGIVNGNLTSNRFNNCSTGSPYCFDGRCRSGRIPNANGMNCTCPAVDPHRVDQEPFVDMTLEETTNDRGENSDVDVSVLMMQTYPPRINATVSWNNSVYYPVELECVLQWTGVLKNFKVSDLFAMAGTISNENETWPDGAWCVKSLTNETLRLICRLEIDYVETTELLADDNQTQRRNIGNTPLYLDHYYYNRTVHTEIKFHLQAAATINVSAQAYVLGSTPLWALISKSAARPNLTLGTADVDIVLRTHAPIAEHIQSDSISWNLFGAVIDIKNLTLSNPNLYREQTWSFTMVLNRSISFGPNDRAVFNFTLRHYNDSAEAPNETSAPVFYNTALTVSVALWESLCSISTGKVVEMNNSVVVAHDRTLAVTQSQYFWPGDDVFVGIKLALEWASGENQEITANVTDLVASGLGVVGGEIHPAYNEFECHSLNFSVCYWLHLEDNSTYVTNEIVDLMATINVTSLVDASPYQEHYAKRSEVVRLRREKSAVVKAHFRMGPAQRPAVQIPAAQVKQPEEIVVVQYKMPAMTSVGLAAVAVASGFSVAAVAYYMQQRRRNEAL